MVVSMIQILIELPEVSTIKDKRMIVSSLKEKIIRKYKVSCAEIDLQDAHHFAQLGAALVSNSKSHGEAVMHKILAFTEKLVPGRVHDTSIHSEFY